MSHEQRMKMATNLVWDYDSEPQEILQVIEGQQDRVAGLDADDLFVRALKEAAWHTIVELFGIDNVRRRLSQENIARLWPPALRERYERVRKLLRGETVSVAGWGSSDSRQRIRETLRERTFSNRWYRA